MSHRIRNLAVILFGLLMFAVGGSWLIGSRSHEDLRTSSKSDSSSQDDGLVSVSRDAHRGRKEPKPATQGETEEGRWVLVVDSQGLPLTDVLVSQITFDEDGNKVETVESARTDARGYVCFTQPGDPEWGHDVAVVPSLGETPIRGNLGELGSTTVLVVPHTGTIEVTLDLCGWVPDKAQCWLVAEDPYGRPRFMGRDQPPQTFVDNRLLWRHIPENVAFRVVPSIDGRRRSSIQKTSILLAPNEHRRIELASSHPVIRARVIDQAGNPISNQKMTVSLSRRPGAASITPPIPGQTDGAGIFHGLAWQRHDQDHNARLEFTRAYKKVAYEHPVPSTRTKRLIDLGEVCIGVRETVAHGLVLDASGQPISGASVWLEEQIHNRWVSCAHQEDTPMTSKDGAYKIQAIWSSGREYRVACRLGIPTWKEITHSLPFRSVNRRHDFKLTPPLGIGGRVDFGGGIDHKSLRVCIEGDHPDGARYEGDVNRQGAFAFVGIPDAKYTLTLSWIGREVAIERALVPRTLTDPPDPRLDPITITGTKRVEVAIRNSEGRPMAHRSFDYAIEGMKRPRNASADNKGQITLLIPASYTGLLFLSAGTISRLNPTYQWAQVQIRSAKESVTLKTAPTVRFLPRPSPSAPRTVVVKVEASAWERFPFLAEQGPRILLSETEVEVQLPFDELVSFDTVRREQQTPVLRPKSQSARIHLNRKNVVEIAWD